MMFAHHFKSNVNQITVTSTFETPADVVQQAIDGLLDAVSTEGDVLSGVYAKLIEVAESLDSLSVVDAIKKIAAILGEGMLSSVRVVVDALMEALAALAMDRDPEISFLDLFLWIGAVSFEIVYKIVYDETPFPDNSSVNAVISATSWDALLALFGGASSSTAKVKGAVGAKSRTQAISLPHEVQKIIHIAGHASAGFTLFVGDFLVGFEAEAPTSENPFAIPAAILGVVVAVLEGGTEVLVPSCPIQNKIVSDVSTATTVAVIVSKIIFSGPVQSRLAVASSGFSGLAVGDGRATGSIVNSILVIPALFVTGWHFYELSQLPASEERSAAILGEVTNLTSYGSRICYAVAVNDKDPVTQQIPIIAMLACNVVSGGLQTAEAFLVE
ncbi:hypothetical protein GGR54DRAFT_648116 [Hypoxylon sp. NC1633]|nr:hypothetical protein GGR54DRAFT_648116 [Hypoxylon sp. NC1633]